MNTTILEITYSDQEYLNTLRRILNAWALDNPKEFSYKTIFNHTDEQISDTREDC